MEKVTDIQVAKKFMALKTSAESRGIEFGLSLKKVRQILNTKKCFISGTKLNRIEKSPNQLTFDRIDNTKGYVDDNIVACSLSANQLKADLTFKQIEMLYNAITKAINKKNNVKSLVD